MKIKSVLFIIGLLFLAGLGGLAISCGIIEPESPPAPVAKIIVPDVSHSIEGRDDCRLCHSTGIAGAPQYPVETHANRPSDLCMACHQLASIDLSSPEQQVPARDRNAFPYFESGKENVTSEPAQPSETTEPKTQPTGTTTPAASGQQIYAANCAVCHGAGGEGTPIAPAITAQSLAGKSHAELTDIIINGTGTMPAFASLSTEQVDALIQFMTQGEATTGTQPTATTTPAQPTETTAPAASGQEIYNTSCAACHGANRQGIPGFAPALTAEEMAGESDAELRDVIVNGDGAMPPFSNLTADEVDSLIQFIKN